MYAPKYKNMYAPKYKKRYTLAPPKFTHYGAQICTHLSSKNSKKKWALGVKRFKKRVRQVCKN